MVFVPDCFKTQEMCNEAHSNWPWPPLIPDHLMMQETCSEIIKAMPKWFICIYECLKKQGICSRREKLWK